MDKIHIERGSVQETLIIPLYGRKLCAEQFPTLYQDEYAAKICDSIDYDFSWMDQIDGANGAVFYAAGVFHYFTKQQIRDMVIAMADRFPGGRLVFDAVGKIGRDKLMKGTLKNMGMDDVSGLFCVDDRSELEGWFPKVKLMTKKSYMQGYYKLDDPNIKGIHRFLAKLCESLAKMYIYQMEFNRPLCESNARAEGVTNVDFRQGDALHLDFPDETFDAVASNYVYHNIPSKDRQAILLETLRTLKSKLAHSRAFSRESASKGNI